MMRIVKWVGCNELFHVFLAENESEKVYSDGGYSWGICDFLSFFRSRISSSVKKGSVTGIAVKIEYVSKSFLIIFTASYEYGMKCDWNKNVFFEYQIMSFQYICFFDSINGNIFA